VRATVQDGRMSIQGHTLTSPAGWEAMKAALRAANVSLEEQTAAAHCVQGPCVPVTTAAAAADAVH
jgi:hypothetical protein